MTQGSMNTKPSNDALSAALQKLPKELRERIVTQYVAVREAAASGQFDAVGVRTGKLSESLLRLLQQELTGSHLPWGHKKLNMVQESAKLEQIPEAAGPEGLRVIMPRAL